MIHPTTHGRTPVKFKTADEARAALANDGLGLVTRIGNLIRVTSVFGSGEFTVKQWSDSLIENKEWTNDNGEFRHEAREREEATLPNGERPAVRVLRFPDGAEQRSEADLPEVRVHGDVL